MRRPSGNCASCPGGGASKRGFYLAMPPEHAAVITDKVMEIVGPAAGSGVVLIASMDIRRYVKKMIEPRIDWLKVYSYQELGSLVELRPVGRVSV